MLLTAALVGTERHFSAQRARVGLLVSDILTSYPASSHAGEVTYLIVAGLAEWTVEDTPYIAQAGVGQIDQPARVPHGRRTKGRPFFGTWCWSGDRDRSTFLIIDTP